MQIQTIDACKNLPNKFIHNNNSVTQHKRACTICKHSELAKIDEMLLTLQDDEVIKKYKINKQIINRHRIAIHLTGNISELARSVTARNIERFNNDCTDNFAFNFNKLMLELAGLLNDNKQPANIQILNQYAQILVANRNPETVSKIPQAQQEIGQVIDINNDNK